MDIVKVAESIRCARTALGIEFGSTRIKAVLVDETNQPIASGSHEWENRYVNHIWTYTLEDIWTGLQSCYADLKRDIQKRYHITPTTYGAIGFSGMMHGYLPFDEENQLLTEFRTWRNSMTKAASEKLSEVFQFNIPQRWSIAHLYQAILNKEEHVEKVRFMTTLSGYIHWQLTGQKVLGIGDAAGMFPIDAVHHTYQEKMVKQFESLVADHRYPWKLQDILPQIRVAGEKAGTLTMQGARRLDVEGDLKPGIPVCPPEGDGGTGMTATNSVAVHTGNVSAGTSIFAMVVLDKALSRPYKEIDMVTTPDGEPVAMVHCNNCTSDLNAWVNLFQECLTTFGAEVDKDTLFGTLYRKAMEGEKDGGGLLAYNYVSGEHITGIEEGRPLFIRRPDSHFTMANFMRTHLYASLSTLRIGMNILMEQEQVHVKKMLGHGGLFKTEGVGQSIMAAALHAPVCVMETAGEGGAWGIALLASYMLHRNDGEGLTEYLAQHVFDKAHSRQMSPDAESMEGFDTFIKRYAEGLSIERAAAHHM